ncbi:MAG TPA: hypothetical protein VLY03_01470 [Bacteroidota bacterium]|nr:hypothetical protein [Bacteroidota bacterium]
MKCSKRSIILIGALLPVLLNLSCKESLPTYVAPTNVLSLSVGSIEQLNDHLAPPGNQKIQLTIDGANTFNEVFEDTVDFKGSVRIWWLRKPDKFKTIYLSQKNLSDPTLVQDGKMMLVPGQHFSMDLVWNLRSDAGEYLPADMDYVNLRQRYCDPNVRCSNPETFVVEVSLNVYDRLGYISAPAAQFTFIGRVCDVQGYPPCD